MPKVSMKQVDVSDTKTESPTTQSAEVNEQTAGPQLGKLQSVQFKFPTDVINLSTLNRVASSQACLSMFSLFGVDGILISSKDDRVKVSTFVPMSNVAGLKYDA